MKQHLHLTIGPVQSFVAQSRRTRDLWGSSYLLSFLAAHAMSGAKRAGGVIVRPRVDDDPMLQWVSGQGSPPRLGSLPNQFTVEIDDGAHPIEIATAADKGLRDAWRRVCGAVWDRYVAHAVSAGNGTDAIWKRQIEGFWDVAWVAGAPTEHGLLARRKCWRTHWLPEEPGNKCTVMPELQELSGYVRATERVRQEAFWYVMRAQTGDFDLRDNERLSAIALVKRLYPRVSQQALGCSLEVTHWPSTIDVAAVPWCQGLLALAPQDAEAYADVVTKASDHVLTGGVSSLLNPPPDGAQQFLRLDANWFQRSFVANPKLAPLPNEGSRESVLAQLKKLTDVQVEGCPLGSPAVYFALLLADGDLLGEMIVKAGSDTVSSALAKFTCAVPDIVQRRRGVTVYAGGDDVLALLPLEGALECAREMECEYRRSFGSGVSATLSVAVVFAHARDPLNQILAEAHRLLDEIAKEENGRASLSVGVYRDGAAALQWTTTWERSSSNGTRKDAVECLCRVARELGTEGGRLSGSLVHDLRRMLSLLCGTSSIAMAPGAFAKLGEGIDITALVHAEIEHRFGHHEGSCETVDVGRLASLVCDVLGQSRRNEKKKVSSYVGIDGLLLANFLASGGCGEEHGP